MKNTQANFSNLSSIKPTTSFEEYATECGMSPLEGPYAVVFNLEVTDEDYSIYCNEENGDMGDRLCDAFYGTGIDGYRFLEEIAEEGFDSDDPEYLAKLFEERLLIIKYLHAGGFVPGDLRFVLIDKRTH